MVTPLRFAGLGLLCLIGACARPMQAEASRPATATVVDPIALLAKANAFPGEILVSRPQLRRIDRYGATIAGEPSGPRIWRWASQTKQIVAVLVMQQVAEGRIDLDVPISRYLPGFQSPNRDSITARMLLRHQTGLPNPDDTAPGGDAFPAYYFKSYNGNRDPLTGYCAGPVKGAAGGPWSYNNCDYIVAGALLKAVTGKNWQTLAQERIFRPLGMTRTGAFPTRVKTVAGQGEPPIDLATFDSAAGLYGPLDDLLKFDTALMDGKLLPEAARAQLWDGQPQLGYIALGQWVFTAKLKDCAEPVRIVERRGAIGGIEMRNLMIPAQNISVIAFASRADFDFGEIWQGKGLSHDLLNLAVCVPVPAA